MPGIRVDIQNDFDTVDYNVLVSKLRSVGADNLAVKWFSSYLSECKQLDVHGRLLFLRTLSVVVCHRVPFLDHCCLLCTSMIHLLLETVNCVCVWMNNYYKLVGILKMLNK